MKIYVVFGATGEYSEHTEWPVKAFYDEEKAKTLVVLAQARAKELEASGQGYFSHQLQEQKLNEYDPDMQIDYTGTHYYYFTMEVE